MHFIVGSMLFKFSFSTIFFFWLSLKLDNFRLLLTVESLRLLLKFFRAVMKGVLLRSKLVANQ